MNLSDNGRRYLDGLSLTDDQAAAAGERFSNVVVTAGAGSGKTRTLVARYVSLLADGLVPEAVLAITFTEKAAREMRSRVRSELRRLVVESRSEEERSFWQPLERRMEAARIGTIHSLCAEVIRMVPAAAGVDPQFQVMEEGITAIYRADVVNQVLAEASQDINLRSLFEVFKSQSLGEMLTQMLEKRLSLSDWQIEAGGIWKPFAELVVEFFLDEEIQSVIKDLKNIKQTGDLQQDTNEKGIEQVETLLALWQEFEQVWKNKNIVDCCRLLTRIRKEGVGGNFGKKNSQSKQMILLLRERYDERIKIWLDNDPLDEVLEQIYQDVIPLLKSLFDRAEDLYRQLLDNEQALDFDDLESIALTLLKREEVAFQWQNLIAAVLVDEFQDTNQRQRKIVEAICGEKPGKLFVVGDARQSIYRFRGADVTVFQTLQLQTKQQNGLLSDLDLTFRTHTPLLDGLGVILQEIMGTEDSARPLFEVPFTAMRSERETPAHNHPPYLECQIGFGENSEAGRQAAAVKLVNRLLTLKAGGEIVHWQDVALLFRASSAFSVYEGALEKAGIPYVTVAGRGFYDRPEIRDILNILRALADPWDDLAMTGLLRSPAIGMSDLGIYQLRWGEENQKTSLEKALRERSCDPLNEADQTAAVRAQNLMEKICPKIGSVPVVEVIELVLSETCYRAVLAGREERVWRNVDKLLQDSYASHLTSVHAYFEILERLKVSGAREGEAPGEAGEAVQLMTIHKAKGLEFPVVVLADMGRQDHHFKGRWLQLGDTLVTCKGDRFEYEPLLFRLAKKAEKEQAEAETKRLLYVAATRVKDKLILNGHCSEGRAKYSVNGWLKDVLSVMDLDPGDAVQYRTGKNVSLPNGQLVWVEASNSFVVNQTGFSNSQAEKKQTNIGSLYKPIADKEKPQYPQEEKYEGKTRLLPDPHQPADQTLIGKMLHRVLQYWQFPSQTEVENLLHRTGLEFGIIDLVPRQAAVNLVKIYLKRLQAHPIYEDINRASVRYHEVPYGLMDEPKSDSGRLDILYQLDGQWWIVDFKTDPIKAAIGLFPNRVEGYTRQLLRYRDAVELQLKVKVNARLCFLDYEGEIRLFDLEEGGLVNSPV